MDIFDIQVKEDKLHKNFTSILSAPRQTERDLFQKWANGFIDRDGKLVKELQTTFNSTFWEIYLHAAFKEYGFSVDWSNSSPDFTINAKGTDIIVEAVTASAAQGKPNEWDKTFGKEELETLTRFKKLNIEAMIRLSNAICKKSQKYEKHYKKLEHVAGKPFVLAVAPFEQPYFNLQYDRAIKALLYDHYVDEDVFLDNPEKYPNGPPSVNLGYIEKDNGSEIDLGLFNSPKMSEVSAVMFSCVATWGKVSAMAINEDGGGIVRATWATPPNGKPEARFFKPQECSETILDGLQIFHNPYATYPVAPEVFRSEGVVQFYLDESTGEWVHESSSNHLQSRLTISFSSFK